MWRLRRALRMFFFLFSSVFKSKLSVISIGIRCYIVWNLFRFGIRLDCLLSTKRFSEIGITWINNGEAMWAWHTDFGSFNQNFFGWAKCFKIKHSQSSIMRRRNKESLEWDNFQPTSMPFKYKFLWFTTGSRWPFDFWKRPRKKFSRWICNHFSARKGSTIYRSQHEFIWEHSWLCLIDFAGIKSREASARRGGIVEITVELSVSCWSELILNI